MLGCVINYALFCTMFYILYPILYCILRVLGDKGSGKAAMTEVKSKKSNFFEGREFGIYV